MEGHIRNGIPPFDGNNYACWRKRMQTYLKNLGVYIWLSVFNGYKVLKNTPTDQDENKLMSCNSKSMHVIMSGLTPIVSSKVMGCNASKEVWDKLKNIYEGDLKVK
jgi:hypothetical protein